MKTPLLFQNVEVSFYVKKNLFFVIYLNVLKKYNFGHTQLFKLLYYLFSGQSILKDRD